MKVNSLLWFSVLPLVLGSSMAVEASSPKGTGKEVTCQKNGFICDGCTTSSFCTQLHDLTYELTKIEDCPVGSACDEDSGRCVTYDVPECDQGYKFKCHHPGMLPDPFDCTKYHICTEEEPGVFKDHEQYCPEGYAYNYLEMTCGVDIEVSGCEAPVKECTYAGEMGRVGMHESMFYICTRSDGGARLYPELYYCFYDMRFLGDRCGNPDTGKGDGDTCKEAGTFFSNNGCEYYNKCYGPGGSLLMERCSCQQRYDFLADSCVPYGCYFLDVNN